MPDDIFAKKGRVRPPSVHITYEVETGGAMQMKELPFVVGVIADLCGHADPSKKLKERKFTEIDRDNFDEVLGSIAPKLQLKDVDNELSGDGTKLTIDLDFHKMKDFGPDSVAEQVPALKSLLLARGELKDLLSRQETNDRLGELLSEVTTNSVMREKLMNAMTGLESEASGPAETTQTNDSPGSGGADDSSPSDDQPVTE